MEVEQNSDKENEHDASLSLDTSNGIVDDSSGASCRDPYKTIEPSAEASINKSSHVLPTSLETGDLCAKTRMLRRIAKTDAHFKHQQRGEPDLTFQEKLLIATGVFDKNPVTFLSRFGRYLVDADLEVFEPLKDKYEVAFYLSEVRKRLDDKVSDMKIRNRRFEAMKKMTVQGDYFDEEIMKSRDPLLYEQMIGQYLTDEQIHARVEDKDLGFSSVLLQHVQAMQDTELYNRLRDVEDGQREEEESDDEEMEVAGDGTNEDGISTLDKQMLRNEFLRTMQLRFLNGDDTEHFDYREVDENVEYDSLDIREHDEEEKYFDNDTDESSEEKFQSYPSSKGLTNRRDVLERVPPNGQLCSADSSDEIDYENYEVKEDIRPGLLDRESESKKNALSSDLATPTENG